MLIIFLSLLLLLLKKCLSIGNNINKRESFLYRGEFVSIHIRKNMHREELHISSISVKELIKTFV